MIFTSHLSCFITTEELCYSARNIETTSRASTLRGSITSQGFVQIGDIMVEQLPDEKYLVDPFKRPIAKKVIKWHLDALGVKLFTEYQL